MAKIRTKGTKLQQKVGTAFVDVAQVISLDLPEMESETFESDTLDNADAGIPYSSTGRVEGGSASGELFYDPDLSGHQDLLDLLTNPPAIDSPESWKIVFADTSTSEWAFDGPGFTFGGAVALGDGLKGTFSIKLSKIPTFP
jgi:hypothetical protein